MGSCCTHAIPPPVAQPASCGAPLRHPPCTPCWMAAATAWALPEVREAGSTLPPEPCGAGQQEVHCSCSSSSRAGGRLLAEASERGPSARLHARYPSAFPQGHHARRRAWLRAAATAVALAPYLVTARTAACASCWVRPWAGARVAAVATASELPAEVALAISWAAPSMLPDARAAGEQAGRGGTEQTRGMERQSGVWLHVPSSLASFPAAQQLQAVPRRAACTYT